MAGLVSKETHSQGSSEWMHPAPIHTRILKVYTEPLIGFSHIVTPDVDSLNNYSLTAVSLKTAPTVGTVGRECIPRIGAAEALITQLLLRSQLEGTFSQ